MNIIYTFLTQLGVRRVSEHYCRKMLLSAPMSDTLLGIKNLLARMGVPTRGVRYEDLTQNPQFPSIVHIGTSFEVASEENWEKQKVYWDGIALLPLEFDSAKVVEPDYRKNLWMRIFEWLCVVGVFALIPLSMLFARISTPQLSTLCSQLSALNSQPITILLAALHLVGLAIGFLLLQKSITGHSRVGDKLCNMLGERRSCSDVLDSPAAKILGFSWSEIGFGYFLAQFTALFVLPNSSFFIISLCAMLYAFWSIGYQWHHHSWCVLCLLTQVVLWSEGIVILIVFGLSFILSFESFAQFVVLFLLSGLFIAFSILVTHFLANYLIERRRRENNEWVMQGMLRRKDIFLTLLSTRPDCPYTEADINERQGNPDCPLADAVVIFTRPNTCGHCKALLPKEEQFVNHVGNRIALCHINLDKLDAEQRSETYERLGLNATPRILYRNRILPDEYSLADLEEFL